MHEEFVEAIIRLHEEKLGVSQARPSGTLASQTTRVATTPMRSSVMVQLLPAIHRIKSQGLLPEETLERALKSHPWRLLLVRLPVVLMSDNDVLLQDPLEPKTASGPKQAIDEPTMADSFIMNVLRGWRLLQAAGLTAEEQRAILSTTRNSLDHEVVSQALKDFGMINFLGPTAATTPIMSTTGNSPPTRTTYQDEEWPGDEWWPDYQAFYNYQDPGDDGDWWGDGGDYHLQTATEDPDFEEDEKLKEALKMEKLAEGMASEAQDMDRGPACDPSSSARSWLRRSFWPSWLWQVFHLWGSMRLPGQTSPHDLQGLQQGQGQV